MKPIFLLEEKKEGRSLLCAGHGRNPELVNPMLIFGSLSCEPRVLWFFITRPGSQAIMEANWLMISCLAWTGGPTVHAARVNESGFGEHINLFVFVDSHS